MDEHTKRMFIEMLEHDRTWAKEVFGETGVVRDAAMRGGIAMPPEMGQFFGNFIAEEQMTDLTKGIEVIENPPDCLDPSFKRYLVTILRSDSDWYLRTETLGYSEFNKTPEEICRQIESGLSELEAIPSCRI